MKSIKQYIVESTKEHAYILKLAVEPTADQLKVIENYFKNFGLVHFSKLQKASDERFDFFDISNRDVYSIRFVTQTPLSSYVVQQEIRAILNLPEKYVVVRTSNEPVEVEAEDERFRQATDQDAIDKGLHVGPRLSIKRFYDDAEQPVVDPAYGDEYNKNFLEYLASIKSTRAPDEVDAQMPLFSWLQMKKVKSAEPVQDTSDFNANYNTPKAVTKASANAKYPVKPSAVGANGNFDDGASTNVRFFIDPKTGKETVVAAVRAAKKAKE
jgi:hypothetical protein